MSFKLSHPRKLEFVACWTKSVLNLGRNVLPLMAKRLDKGECKVPTRRCLALKVGADGNTTPAVPAI